MLTAEGCRRRRERLWAKLDPPPESDHLLLADPIHLSYFANYCVDPISLNVGMPGYLMIRKDGHAKLLCTNRTAKLMDAAHVEERRAIPWYDGQTPGHGPRQLAVLSEVNPMRGGVRIHDRPGDLFASQLVRTIADMRRQKDPDEVELLKECMRATDAGHAWARANVKPGMTELDVYAGVSGVCCKTAGKPVVVYGDFAVVDGPPKHGGPPTDRVLKAGDMFILDYSVVINGYRSDFTNTICVGGKPSAEQQKLYDLCMDAMAAGEKQLRAETPCVAVYNAVRGAFEKAKMADSFDHHAGHGIGLTHPEDPYLVRGATQTLLTGDVITLEPGLYIKGVGGCRIENNYLITPAGYERLSNHVISLV